EIDERSNRRTGDRHVHASQRLAPAHAVAFMRHICLADENALENQRRPDDRFNGPRRGGDAVRIRPGKVERLVDRMRPKRPAGVIRLARFVDAHQRSVLVPHRTTPLAITVAHAISLVTITGACEPTYNSCPSREQITPG